jgi:predicted enzyme related to lactoylglutathione lyase
MLAAVMMTLVHAVPLTAQGSSTTTGRISRLANVTVFVRSYDESIAWYQDKLGFVKIEDVAYGEKNRWVTMAPTADSPVRIVLSSTGEMPTVDRAQLVGKQALWVFHTDDAPKAYEQMQAKGVRFTQPPQKLPYGTQAMFEDLYGNTFVLVQAR